jgi:hypothetical protein
MSTAARAALGAALLIAAIVLFVVLQDGEDDSNGGGYGGDRNAKQVQEPAEQKGSKPAEPALPTITVKNGAPVGGVRTIGVDVGGPAAFRIRSNVSDEIHVHGYEVTEAIPAGKAVTISFSADIEGIFEIELHGSGEQIAELQVSP